MISESERLDYLEKVLSSEEFSHSNRNQELLKFLADAAEADQELNEGTIATKFFGKGKDFDPLEDATIRVNISKLRKRLKNYYLDEGKNDKITIDIPKGYYHIEYRKKNENFKHLLKLNFKKMIFPFFTFLLAAIVSYLWIQNNHLRNTIDVLPSNNPIWTEFLTSDKPNLVVLGDYFFMYYDRHGSNPRFNVRDPRINSMEDFNEYQKQATDDGPNLKPLRHTYLRPSAVWGFMDVMPLLRASKSSFIVKQASEIDWEDISSHNVIFIGTVKQMYLLKTLLKNVNIKFSIYPNYLYLNDEKDQEMLKFSSSLNDETREYEDVSLITKFKGPNNNTVILITGFQEGGVIYGSKAISDPNFIDIIQEESQIELKEPLNFLCITKVEGFLRSKTTSKIEFFDIID